MCDVFDAWLPDLGKVSVDYFEDQIAIHAGMSPHECILRPTCGRALAVEHNGDLYPCDHFVSPDERLGNVNDEPLEGLVESDQQEHFGRSKFTTLPRYCMDCAILKHCYGGCPKNRTIETPDGEPGLNYLCEGYRKIFAHTHHHLRTMAAEIVISESTRRWKNRPKN